MNSKSLLFFLNDNEQTAIFGRLRMYRPLEIELSTLKEAPASHLLAKGLFFISCFNHYVFVNI